MIAAADFNPIVLLLFIIVHIYLFNVLVVALHRRRASERHEVHRRACSKGGGRPCHIVLVRSTRRCMCGSLIGCRRRRRCRGRARGSGRYCTGIDYTGCARGHLGPASLRYDRNSGRTAFSPVDRLTAAPRWARTNTYGCGVDASLA